MNDFIAAAKRKLESLDPNGVDAHILGLLIAKGIGRENAIAWGGIDAYLRDCGLVCRKQTFQQGLLKKSRESNFYIGSNDHGEACGYFLIQNLEDSQVMMKWYQKRIATEQSRLDHLVKLCA